MDQPQYSSLIGVLAVIPDAHALRGKRFGWTLMHTWLAAGLASGQQTVHAITQWIGLHAITLGEDRNHMHTDHAPQVLAALRNGFLTLWRRAGWKNMAAAVRATGASVAAALAFIGASRL